MIWKVQSRLVNNEQVSSLARSQESQDEVGDVIIKTNSGAFPLMNEWDTHFIAVVTVHTV